MTRNEFMALALTRYDVTKDGKVIRTTKPLGRYPRSNEVSQYITDSGYAVVSLCVNRIRKTAQVHRLVAYKYLGESTQDVNHKDGNKLNNHIDNLEYMDKRAHALHHARVSENPPSARISRTLANEIKQRLQSGERSSDIAKDLGLRYNLVWNIKAGNTWAH